ncbi:hypothetical protein [Yoonia sp. 208BN28-4]|uniref:hypothetical protein n=1 Tax=Yoonia sp. 208BN28-4 TaxID=3126505 RepID=UPI0030B4958D
MVDYTTSKSSGSSVGLILAAAFIAAVVLYAIYAGSGSSTDSATPTDAPAVLEGVPDSTAPATVPTE